MPGTTPPCSLHAVHATRSPQQHRTACDAGSVTGGYVGAAATRAAGPGLPLLRCSADAPVFGMAQPTEWLGGRRMRIGRPRTSRQARPGRSGAYVRSHPAWTRLICGVGRRPGLAQAWRSSAAVQHVPCGSGRSESLHLAGSWLVRKLASANVTQQSRGQSQTARATTHHSAAFEEYLESWTLCHCNDNLPT